jgi:endo-1,3-1,4-beta-glycanase ExoK
MRIVSNFVLFLILITIATEAKDYRGAELYSKETLKYGRFELRMRVAYGSGTLSTFFLYYDDSWLGLPEPWREIDLEVLGKNNDRFQSNIITGHLANKVTSEDMHNCGTNISTGYHTYAVEWTPDYIAWYFDDKLLRKSTGQQVTDCREKEMSYRFNMWISSVPSWVGPFNPSVLPLYQYINWVKYYTHTPGNGQNGTDFTFAWEDNFDKLDTQRWGKADWTFDENLVDFYPGNIVVKEGYCILCLTTNSTSGHSGEVPKDPQVSIKPALNHTTKLPAIRIVQADQQHMRIECSGMQDPRVNIYSISGRLLHRQTVNSKNQSFLDIPYDATQANSMRIIQLSDSKSKVTGKMVLLE